MGTGHSKRKKQARELQGKLMNMQKEMVEKEVSGQAGNGLVQVVMTGEYKIKSFKINPECVDPEDIEGLEDLVKAAFTDALTKLDKPSEGSALDQIKGMSSMEGIPPEMANLLKGFGIQ